jgi:HTH-type transcriptional regulator/antitoxin HipB
MDYPISFANQLKQHLRSFRKARGLTQAALARRLGVVQSRVAQLERNPNAMSVDVLFRLLESLDVQLVLRDAHSTLGQSSMSHEDQDNEPRGMW